MADVNVASVYLIVVPNLMTNVWNFKIRFFWKGKKIFDLRLDFWVSFQLL